MTTHTRKTEFAEIVENQNLMNNIEELCSRCVQTELFCIVTVIVLTLRSFTSHCCNISVIQMVQNRSSLVSLDLVDAEFVGVLVYFIRRYLTTLIRSFLVR